MKPTKRSVGLIVYAAHDENDATSYSPLATPAGGARSSNDGVSVQGVFSGYLTPGILQDVKAAVNTSDVRLTPYLQLPAGSVLVNSAFGDGTGGLATVGFGGGSMASRNRATTWELQSETNFYAPGSARHRLKVNGDLRYDDVRRTNDAGSNGGFTFNSLADLSAGRATTFTRTLSNPVRTGSEWNGFVSIGDFYKVTPRFQLLYGVRAEGNHYTERPLYNAAVDAAFGARTDAAPERFHVSPRAGFTWSYSKGGRGAGWTWNGWGKFPMAETGVIRGGIGEFRSMLSPALLAEPGARTGLPGGLHTVSCVGDAVPTPDWASYLSATASVPQDCVGGVGALRDAAPSVQLVDRAYGASRSWRANLSWTGAVGVFTAFVEGVYSLNLNQPGVRDLNFAGVPKFILSDEGRPVFVSPANIVAATGAVSATDARLNPAFGRVLTVGSDLRGEARQITGMLSAFSGSSSLSLAYTLQSARAEQRGFDASTFDAPTQPSWARGDFDVRHSVVLQAGYAFKYVNVSLAGRMSSGRPFTPLVAGDVNGDGSNNDRAFIFDPATATDPGVAGGMRALLASAPSNVRSCLLAQIGRAATRNSCEGPWTADFNARIGFNTYWLGEPWRRWNVELVLSNPLGGLDQLLHGSNLQGWGNPTLPDPTLLQVTGFDAVARRFRYAINPRFGDTRPANTTSRAPFRVTLSAQIDIGTPMGEQQLDRFLRPGRAGHAGKRLTADELKKRYARNVPDPYRNILENTDSLLLQPEQVRALQQAQAKFAARLDSAWTVLSVYLAALPDRFDAADVVKRQEAVIDQVWDMGRPEMQTVLPKILTPLQLKMLPWPAEMFFKAKEPIKGVRMFFYGDP